MIKYHRLAPEKPVIPVIIDASRSMALFSPESTILPIVERLQNLNKSNKKGPHFDFFLFGDTLRRIRSVTDMKFEDTYSNVPDLSSKDLRYLQDIIVLSDANWSDNNSLLDRFSEHAVYYYPLPKAVNKPYLQLTIRDTLDTSENVSKKLTVLVEGYTSKKKQLTFSLFEKMSKVVEKVIPIDSGDIQSQISFSLPAQNPGKHLYRIKATGDSLSSETFYLKFVDPSHYTYTSYSKVPSLDIRFFSLALQRHPEFIKSDSKNSSDLLILYNYNSSMIKSSHLTKTGIIAFLGCAPCSSSASPYPTDGKVVKLSKSPDSPINNLPFNDLPPLTSLQVNQKISFPEQLLSLTFSYSHKQDTVPIVYTGNLNSKRFIALTTCDFWKWDFLPLSLSRNETQEFLFSEQLILTIKEILLSRIAGDFYAYPIRSQDISDKINFALSFPSDIPVPAAVDVKLSLSNKETSARIDTSYRVTTTGALLQYIKLPQLKPGIYKYTCEFSFENKKHSYSDFVSITEESEELHVRNQNTLLLEQYGQAIRLDSDSLINQFLQSVKSEIRPPIEEFFQITRSWFLIGAILALLALEWGLRKKFDLD